MEDVTSVYINYPNPHFSARHGVTVAQRLRQEKAGRRTIVLRAETIEGGLASIGELKFASIAELNDLWLEIDFGDEVFERSIAEYVQRLLGARYRPLATAPWKD